MSEAEAERQQARHLFQQGRVDDAVRLFSGLLARNPKDAEALNFLAQAALRRGQTLEAIGLLFRAWNAQPTNTVTLTHLGLAQQTAGDFAGAVDAFDQVLHLKPDHHVVRLHKGAALERLGRNRDALLCYQKAIEGAQTEGWLNPGRTASPFQDRLLHAMRFVDLQRREVFGSVLAPLTARFGADPLHRAEQALEDYLAQLVLNHFPHLCTYRLALGTGPGAARPPALAELEAATADIIEDLRPVLESPGARAAKGGRFDYFLYRAGLRHEVNCEACPQAAMALEMLPLSGLPNRTPEVCFSIFKPGEHAQPRGLTNARIKVVLPLIVAGPCEVGVGGQAVAWQVGHAIVLDDTADTAIVNRAEGACVALMLDLWHPEVTEAEQAAVAAVVGAADDLQMESEKTPT